MGNVKAEASMYIGGTRVRSDEWVVAHNPAALSEEVGRFPQGRESHAHDAVAAADEAFDSWRRVPVKDRAEMLTNAAADLAEASPQWHELFTREHGKVLAEAKLDFDLTVMLLNYYGSHPELLDSSVVDGDRGRTVVHKEPLGVAAAVVPWNWPPTLAAMKIGPALLAGNTVVVKGPDYSSIAFLLALEQVASHFPPGVLNVLSGRGPEVGRALVTDPRVRKVAFTGGTATGRIVAADAAPDLKRVTLELGGNDAAVILPDVELSDDLARSLTRGAFTSSGQICFCVKRIYAPQSIFADLVDLMSSAIDEIVVGSGLSSNVTMGPVNNERQYESVNNLLAKSEAAGLQVRKLGTADSSMSLEDGYFIQPHLVVNPPDEADVVKQEQFGPVLPIMAYDTEIEAIQRANNSEYGLCSSIWTSDEQRAYQLAQELEAGTTFINGHDLMMLDFGAPFGGVKDSGYGRELGPDSVSEYVQLHSVIGGRN
jgi:aldehyde dehydrogenase